MLAGADEFVADGLVPTGAFVLPAAQKPSQAAPAALANPAAPVYPAREKAALALKAYNYLKVDAGRLSPYTAGWLKKSAGAVPSGFSVVDDAPVAVSMNTRAGVVGVLFFPVGKNPGRTPTEEQFAQVVKAGNKLKFSSDLVIGVSPWGMQGERDFLPHAQGVFDCLLGAGEGPGFAQSISGSAPGVLWARPDTSGRAVNVIEIMELPTRGQAGNWLEGITFKASLTYLEMKLAPDRGMIGIIGEPPK